VVRNWWRQDGHALALDDLPSHLVVGTGADGCMRPDPDAPARTAVALHLTC
jgi:hypothetical protein